MNHIKHETLRLSNSRSKFTILLYISCTLYLSNPLYLIGGDLKNFDFKMNFEIQKVVMHIQKFFT